MAELKSEDLGVLLVLSLVHELNEQGLLPTDKFVARLRSNALAVRPTAPEVGDKMLELASAIAIAKKGNHEGKTE